MGGCGALLRLMGPRGKASCHAQHLVVVVHVKHLHGLSSMLGRQEVGQVLSRYVVPALAQTLELAEEHRLYSKPPQLHA